MVNQSKKVLILLLALFGTTLAAPQLVHAAEESPGDFGVKAELPDNQIDKNISYFDLLVTPGQEQTINVVVHNSAAQERTFDVNVNPAVTSDGGTIDYGQKNTKLDKTVPFDVRKAVTVDNNEVTVGANTEAKVPITIKVPNKTFKGRVLAGVNVSPKEADTTKTSSSGNSVSIKNKIGYNLAIVLQQSKDPVTPDLKLLSAKVASVNSFPNIQLHFQNPTATIISNLVFSTKVYYKDKLFIKNTSNPYLVAPNSNFHLNLGLDKQAAQAGDYTAKVTAKDKAGHEWTFDQDFTVKKQKAEAVNKDSVVKPQQNNNWLIIGLLIIVVIALGVIIFLLLKRKKKEED